MSSVMFDALNGAIIFDDSPANPNNRSARKTMKTMTDIAKAAMQRPFCIWQFTSYANPENRVFSVRYFRVRKLLQMKLTTLV